MLASVCDFKMRKGTCKVEVLTALPPPPPWEGRRVHLRPLSVLLVRGISRAKAKAPPERDRKCTPMQCLPGLGSERGPFFLHLDLNRTGQKWRRPELPRADPGSTQWIQKSVISLTERLRDEKTRASVEW